METTTGEKSSQNHLQKLQQRLRQLLGEEDASDLTSRCFTALIGVLITINVIVVILSTMPGLGEKCGQCFYLIEIVSVVVFTVELISRIWAIGKLRAIFTPLILIDFLAILPFYLPMLLPLDLRILRILRIIRIFRILKMARYSKAMHMLGRVLRDKTPELVAVCGVLAIILVLISSLVYYCEHEMQPDKFSSIPDTLWWGIVTMTTIGYGDIFPVTTLGKALAAVLALLGIGLFALPAGILGSGFIEELHRNQVNRNTTCPHCGKSLDLDE